MTDSIERAGMLLDVVQKVASVAPAYTAISSIAMAELKEMNDDAQRHLDQLGRDRLKAEQEAAARVNEENRIAMEKQAKIDAEIAERTAVSNVVRPITIMPGEPVSDGSGGPAGNITPPPEDKNMDGIADQQEPFQPIDDAPVTRRV